MMAGLGAGLASGIGRMAEARHRAITSGEVVNLGVNAVVQVGWLVAPLALGALVGDGGLDSGAGRHQRSRPRRSVSTSLDSIRRTGSSGSGLRRPA